MVIVEVCTPRNYGIPGSDHLSLQLATGKMPFPEHLDYSVVVMILKGKRPPKPSHFETPEITPAVWEIAKKCWHEKAKERPEAKDVLQCLENLANPGGYIYEAYFYLPWKLIDLWLK